MTRALLCLALACAFARPALADPPTAAELYHQGDEYFRAGKITDAIEAFSRGYALEPRPEFLLNLAQCYRALGKRSDAIQYYERFITAAPQHPLRPAAERTLAELRQAEALERVEAKHQEHQEPPPAAPPPVAPPPHHRSHTWLWITAGAAAVVGGSVAIYVVTRPASYTDTLRLPPP